MSVSSLNYGSSILSQSVLNLKNQLTTLQAQLTSGVKSTTYAGMGVNEGFAVAARAQLANISAFTDTMTNITTNIGFANTELQAMVNIGTTVQTGANSSNQALNAAGQTSAQQVAVSQLSSMIGILNTQSGNRYLFSGTAINSPATATIDNIMNGTTTQAGLKTVIAQRAVADGTTGLGRLVISTPPATPPATTSTAVSLSEDAAGSPFGLKLNAVSSTLTGATVTGPSGSPSSISIDLGATNPGNGDQVSFSFNLPDGTTESFQLTASSATPPPTGSFAIGATSADTANNLKAALTTAIGTLANTSLVAASAVEAGNDFFNTTSTATGSVVTNQAKVPGLATGATLLSSAAGANALGSGFADGDTLTVNGKTITFSATAATSTSATGGVINLGTGTVQDVLTAIDQISGTTTPSTIDSSGAITLNDDAGNVTVTSSDTTAFTALGFSGGTVTTTGGTAAGSVVQATIPAPMPITGATLLAGAAGTNSLGTSFAPGNTITVNGQTIQFYNSSTTPPTTAGSAASTTYLDLATATVGNLLSNIDSITGTSTPSTISSGGVITLHTDDAAAFSVTSSNPAAFAALGFSGNVTAAQPPLRVGPGSPPTSLVAGTAANTVMWYTGNSGPGSARSTATARVDQSLTVQYGAQANEQGIRAQLQNLAVFAAVTTSPTAPNAAAQVAALSSRIALNLSPSPGQQTIQDIQSDFAAAQSAMKDAASRQTQTQATLQNLVDGAENVSPDQVASEILTLQTNLQASYQTTSMLSQLSLTKYLPIG